MQEVKQYEYEHIHVHVFATNVSWKNKCINPQIYYLSFLSGINKMEHDIVYI